MQPQQYAQPTYPQAQPGPAYVGAYQQQQYAQPAYPQAQPAQQYPPAAGGAILPPMESPPRWRPCGPSVKIRELEGRTVILVPRRVDEQAKGVDGDVRPCAYVDIVVCDGGLLAFGSNADKGLPASHRTATPARFDSAMVSNSNIVDACRKALASGTIRYGVIYRSDAGRRPYNLGRIDALPDGSPRPDAAQREQVAQQVYASLRAGTFIDPPVEEISGARPAQYAQSAYPQQQYAQYAQPVPAQPVQHVPLAQDVPAQPVQHVPPAQPAPAQQYAQAQDGPPPGWAPDIWVTLDPAAQAAIRAQAMGSAAPF